MTIRDNREYTRVLLCSYSPRVSSPRVAAFPCATGTSLPTRPWNMRLTVIWGFPKIRGTLFGGPQNKDYIILGSILGSPYYGNYHIMSEIESSTCNGFEVRRNRRNCRPQ